MRVHLALRVADLEKSIAYYSQVFGAAPSKRKPGYANWALDAPPLKLTLLERPDADERLDHVGVETFDDADVDAATERLEAAGLATRIERGSTCCYARQNKVWTADPQGLRWEFYRVLADADAMLGDAEAVVEKTPSATGAAPVPVAGTACCG